MSLLDSASLTVTPNGFKAGKLYSIVPATGAGDLDVTRATTATRVNSDGLIESVASNIPRLDYTNGSCPSILVEPQRTNLLAYSEDFDDADWDKINVTITANATTSPSGVQDADMTTNSTLVDDRYQQLIFTPSSGFRTISIYAKAGTASIVGLQTYDNVSDAQAFFDLSNGTITSTSGGATATITDVGDGWYRLTHTYNSPTNVVFFQIQLGSQVGTRYFWGAQLEAGSYATSYIKTTSASVTRNADVISKTGISSLIGQTEGTMFLDLDFNNRGTNYLIQLTDGVNDFIELYIAGGVMYFSGYNGASQWTISTSLTNARHKIAYAYKVNDIALYVDGVLIGTDTSAVIPTCTNLYLNQDLSGQYNQQQYYNLTALWKTRLTNTQLAQLTTI